MAKAKFYAALNDTQAAIVDSHDKALLIYQGRAGGHNRSFSTREEAEEYLQKKVAERNVRLAMGNQPRGKFYGSSNQGGQSTNHLRDYL
jgi:viroplasmin and RNaseH domain-containing protein